MFRQNQLRTAASLLRAAPASSACGGTRCGCAGNVRVFWKGASEIILDLCSDALRPDGSTVPMDGSVRKVLRPRHCSP